MRIPSRLKLNRLTKIVTCKRSLCYSRISNLNLTSIRSDYNLSWTARFKTGPVYAKSKSGSISRRVRSKSRPAHALDSLPPCVCGQWSFTCADKSCWKEAAKQPGNEAGQLLCLLVLEVRPNQHQHGLIPYLTCAGIWLGLAWEVTLLVCSST